MSESGEIQHPIKKRASTAARKRAFLAAFRVTASRQKAAVAAGIDRSTHYDWMRTDQKYRQEMERAEEQIGDMLEDEAIRRAYEGIEKPITIAGERELIREYSDTLLIFTLKRFKPDKYRERYDPRNDRTAESGNLPTWDEMVQITRRAHASQDVKLLEAPKP